MDTGKRQKAVIRYYVDATGGDDGNSGRSPAAAWQTIGKVNAASFLPGDSILFKRGETWIGEHLVVPSSGVNENPIMFGAYDSGANPLLDNAPEYDDFALDAGNIWKRSHSPDVNQVWEDGDRLIKAADYGSMVQGSWYQDDTFVYVWCTDDGNPNSGHAITHPASTYSIWDFNGQSDVEVHSIDVANGAANGYDLRQISGSTRLTIQNCRSSHCGLRSFDAGGASGFDHSYIDFINCEAEDSIGEGFWAGFGTQIRLIDCTAHDIDKDASKGYPTTNFGGGYLIGQGAVDCVVEGGSYYDIYYGAPGHVEYEGDPDAPQRTIVRGVWHDQSGVGGNTSLCVMLEGNNTEFYNNVVMCNGGNGIQTGQNGDGQKIYHNTIYVSTSNWFIAAISNTNLSVKNNVMYHPGSTNLAIYVATTAQSGFVSDNNVMHRVSGDNSYYWQGGTPEYPIGLAQWQTVASQDANSNDDDPSFTTPGSDYHIQFGSPCRGAGVTGTGVTDDYDGVTRGSPPDIGAYEYVA